MKKSILFFSLCSVLLSGCSKQESSPAPASDANASGANPMDAPAGYLGGISQAKKTAVRTVDIASVQSAINLFSVEEERYPKSLDELVQKRYIASIPAPPHGQKYLYDAAKGQVKIVTE